LRHRTAPVLPQQIVGRLDHKGLYGRVPVKGEMPQRLQSSGLILVKMPRAATGALASAAFAFPCRLYTMTVRLPWSKSASSDGI
jgi:hypothetical protein